MFDAIHGPNTRKKVIKVMNENGKLATCRNSIHHFQQYTRDDFRDLADLAERGAL
jgi:hypothetical protein